MLKKLTLSLLLCSVVAQPLMAVDIDAKSLVTCMQGMKSMDPEVFGKCLEGSKIPQVTGFAKAVAFANDNAGVLLVGTALASLAYFYCFIWPDVAIETGFNIRYRKNSHAELHAGRRP